MINALYKIRRAIVPSTSIKQHNADPSVSAVSDRRSIGEHLTFTICEESDILADLGLRCGRGGRFASDGSDLSTNETESAPHSREDRLTEYARKIIHKVPNSIASNTL